MINEERIYPVNKKEMHYFLKGPVPLSWLSRSARLPGKTINVSILLCALHG